MGLHLRHKMRLIAIWMMLLPFLGTSLIANGVMPAVAPNGVIMLVICSDGVMVEVAFDPATMQPVASEDEDASGTVKSEYCAWAAAHPEANAPTGSDLPLLASSFGTEMHRLGSTVLRVADATGLPPATGPPSTF